MSARNREPQFIPDRFENISLLQNTNSSILEEQKNTLLNEDLVFLDSIIQPTTNKVLLKSSSEVLLRDSQRMYDINEFIKENRQLNNMKANANDQDSSQFKMDRLNFYFAGQHTNETVSNNEDQNIQIFSNESLLAPS